MLGTSTVTSGNNHQFGAEHVKLIGADEKSAYRTALEQYFHYNHKKTIYRYSFWLIKAKGFIFINNLLKNMLNG